MSRVSLFCLLFLSSLATLTAQDADCRLTDEAGQPIPYASVHFPDQQRGTITDENGNFSLDLVGGADTSKIRFSCLGFKPLVLTVTELKTRMAGECGFQLAEDVSLLTTVEVTADRLRLRKQIIGFNKGINNASFDFRGKPGTEVGSIMSIKKRCLINEVSIRTKKITADSFFLEVSLYDYPSQGAVVGKMLLRERVFLTVSRGNTNQDVTIDLRDQNIWVDNDFLVSYRMLKASSEADQVFMAARTGNNKALINYGDGRWKESYLIPAVWVEVGYPE